MTGFENQNIIRNLVTLDKRLILDDDFIDLYLQRKIFSLGKLNFVKRSESPSLDYSMKLLCRGPGVFTQFIDILI